jgi:hypothetical protein
MQHISSHHVKEVRNKSTRFKTAVASKWTARIGTIVFLSLALFFSNPDSVYGSYFRQIVISLVGWTNSSAWNLIRNVTYVFCLASGLVLIAIFLKKTRDSNWRKEVLAINCAWTAFVIQSSLMLGLQWEAFDVWITMPTMVEVFFWGTVILSIASVLLLTPFRWGRWFGYFVTWTTLIGNIVAFFLILNYWVLYSNPFPSLTFVVVITNSLAIYSLNSELLLNSRLISRFKESKGKLCRLKVIFTRPKVFSVILALVLLPSSVAFFQPYSQWSRSDGKTDEFYTGVSFCGRTAEEAKRLIDRVKNFTNVFVVQSLPISYDETTLNEVCDYAVASDLNVIVYFRMFDEYWQISWLDSAEARWGEKFLGVYLYDEPGGLQLDKPEQIGRPPSELIASYSDAANWFFNGFWSFRTRSDLRMLKMRSIKAYVSDYGLYWFDYKVGYDAVFVQFGWNHSRPLHIALCRGAAKMHERDWGVIVTWTYRGPPYIESGEELYSDAVLAYDSGANYVLVFNYPYASNTTYGILKEEHLAAMRRFWDYTKQNSQPNKLSDVVAYVLPRDYGYGFRGPNDKIWGRFEADDIANQLCVDLNNLLQQYGTRLDVIYEDDLLLNSEATAKYKEIFMWNETK